MQTFCFDSHEIFPQARYSMPNFESSLSLSAVNLKNKLYSNSLSYQQHQSDWKKVVHRKWKFSKTRSKEDDVKMQALPYGLNEKF